MDETIYYAIDAIHIAFSESHESWESVLWMLKTFLRKKI